MKLCQVIKVRVLALVCSILGNIVPTEDIMKYLEKIEDIREVF